MTISTDSKYIKLVSSRLRNFKQKDSYLWNFSCPICGDSQKNKSKARGYVYQKGNGLFYRCHNCSVGTNLGNLIKNLDDSLYKEYVMENYKSGETGVQNRPVSFIDIPPPRFGKLQKETSFTEAEVCSKLPEGHFCLTYLQNRMVPKESYNRLFFTQHYKRFLDALIPDHGKKVVDDARLVIPFYDEYNDLIGVSGRALETSDNKLRYVTLKIKEDTDKMVFGLDRVDLSKPVRIVEGPLDSMFLSNCLASGDSSLHQSVKNIKANNITLIYDNEPRNKEITKLMQEAIALGHNVVIWPDTVEGKDINEMVMNGLSPDEIEDIISNNTFKGIKAQTEFIFWKKV